VGNTFGELFRVTTWGESHGPAIGAVVDGCPSLLELSEADIQPELDRRAPGQSAIVTQRKESDTVRIMSGVFEGRTLGTPISLLIVNEDMRSGDYSEVEQKSRPSHADYTYDAKYGIRDWRGGGRTSARETAGRVSAGAIARKLLQDRQGVEDTVRAIVEAVRGRGEEAVREYSRKLDGWDPAQFRVGREKIDRAYEAVGREGLAEIEFTRAQVQAFAEAQMTALHPLEVELNPGVTLGHDLVPVSSVGCYVPGGHYPLIASVHMQVTTARVAGVTRVIACAPPRVQDAGRDLGLAAHDQRVIVGDQRDQLVLRLLGVDLHLAQLAQARDAVLGQGIRYEDAMQTVLDRH